MGSFVPVIDYPQMVQAISHRLSANKQVRRETMDQDGCRGIPIEPPELRSQSQAGIARHQDLRSESVGLAFHGGRLCLDGLADRFLRVADPPATGHAISVKQEVAKLMGRREAPP